MKKTLLMLAALFASVASLKAQDSMDKLWKQYESARSADKPRTCLQVLERIKQEAAASRSAWDFYKAGKLYVDHGQSVNWKDRDSLMARQDREIRDFGEPVVQFYHDSQRSRSGLFEYVTEHRKELEAGCHPEFYEADGGVSRLSFAPALLPLLKNDYQYALWSLSVRRYYSDPAALTLLDEYTRGRYPENALAEFAAVSRNSNTDRLKAFTAKHDGKAVALLAVQDLLDNSFDLLVRNKLGQEGYIALRKDCGEFEKKRSSFKGDEAVLAKSCVKVEALIENLDGRNLAFDIKDGVLSVTTRNIDEVTYVISVPGGRQVAKAEVKNPVCSYYVEDEFTAAIPVIDDGEYEVKVKSGKVESEKDYERHHLTLLSKKDGRGIAIFLADAKSGRPVSRADIVITDEDGKKAFEYKGFALDGFTYLPQEVDEKISGGRLRSISLYNIQCSYRDERGVLLSTGRNSLNLRNEWYGSGTYRKMRGFLFTDRTAFNPDETVCFKGVVCEGDNVHGLDVAQGREVIVRLLDTQRNLVKEETFTTNEFGSIAGKFLLERRERNGVYHLEMECGGRQLSSQYIQVDDFVLPTFTLDFEEQKNFYLNGDDVEVRGRLSSLSGHGMDGATLSYELRGTHVEEGVFPLSLAPDGTFVIKVHVGENAINDSSTYVAVTVKVVDATGETHEWQTYVYENGSIPVNLHVKSDYNVKLKLAERPESQRRTQGPSLVSSGHLEVSNDMLGHKGLKTVYQLKDSEGKVCASGDLAPGRNLDIDVSGYASGLYILSVDASCPRVDGQMVEGACDYEIILVKEGEKAVNAPIRHMFRVLDGKDIAVQVGAADGPMWACVTLYASGNVPVRSEMLLLDGRKGETGSLATLRYKWEESFGDAVTLYITYVRDGGYEVFEQSFYNAVYNLNLPLSFSRFLDKTAPDTDYAFEIMTRAGVECAATIFDVSTESIRHNRWFTVGLDRPSVPSVTISPRCGVDRSVERRWFMDDARSGGRGVRLMKSAARASVNGMDVVEAMPSVVAEAEEAIPFQMPAGPVKVRENFANTIAFEPFLRSDADGRISFPFHTADKLSTYCVQLFAHDAQMHNAVLRREMLVTIPVKVSLREPQILYGGDHYVAQAGLTSNEDHAIRGTLSMTIYDGKDWKNARTLKTFSRPVTLPAHGSAPQTIVIDVPMDVSELGMLLRFQPEMAGEAGDAVFVSSPVRQPFQHLVEAHSAIWRPGMDRESLIAALRSEFVNMPGASASLREVSILDMVREAIPTKVDPATDDLLTLVDAYYARCLSARLSGTEMVKDAELMKKIADCACRNGGFAWFAGMNPSPIVTATVLDKLAALSRRGFELPFGDQEITAAVHYLDHCFFWNDSRPAWCGWISLEQYIYIRSMYADVPLNLSGADRKIVRHARRQVSEWLVPSSDRGLQGRILAKARRARVLGNLLATENGIDLARTLGVRWFRTRRMQKSLDSDLASLLEYAVPHKSGGMYYPNAVMPFRGLMESELYAHTFICDLIRDLAPQAVQTAEGIRLWMMVQKETQKWADDSAYIDAIASVLEASRDVLDTRVVILESEADLPFRDVVKAGNGFTVSRSYLRDGEELKDGDMLKVGDRITAEYRIWNEENRSFVLLSAPRPASLRPVDDLSGRYGWWLRPLRISDLYAFTPQGYRTVLSDRTEYRFDAYPEEKTVISEEFYVTQAGIFQQPAVEISSLYAPHYRANDDGMAQFFPSER